MIRFKVGFTICLACLSGFKRMCCRYSSHLLVQEDNEQVQKLSDSLCNGEVSVADGVSPRSHAGADKSPKPKVSSAVRVRVRVGMRARSAGAAQHYRCWNATEGNWESSQTGRGRTCEAPKPADCQSSE